MTETSTDAQRRLVEYCYVVSPRERLQGWRPVALPEPADVSVLVPAGRPPVARIAAAGRGG
jgi:hypothetical protein